VSEYDVLDAARLKELFDLTGPSYVTRGGGFTEDPYPRFHELRESGPVHEGIVGPLIGFDDPRAFFQGLPYPDHRHWSCFDWDTCDTVFRDGDTYIAQPPDADENALMFGGILYMDGDKHKRYRALVQPQFLPKHTTWWTEQWTIPAIEALLDRLEAKGSGDLNVEYFSAIPLLTITGSFGISIADSLDIRAAMVSDGNGMAPFFRIVEPLIEARKADPRDDLISLLLREEITNADGTTSKLTDQEVLVFAFLLLAAGSGTTWKQMGITTLALLWHPEWLDAVEQDAKLYRPVVEEAVRWMPTDPMFSRFVAHDTTLAGVDIPGGAVMHMCLAAANRDPARWERPDEFDPGRPLQAQMGFGGGVHTCLGMHVARAEIVAAISMLLERFPNLRLDPDAPAPRITGMYERGPTAIPVLLA